MRCLLRTTLAAACAAAALVPAVAQAASAQSGYNWATADMTDLVAHHGWPASDQGDLARNATRRELARGLAELMTVRGVPLPATLVRPSDITASDPDAHAISWVSTIGLLGSPGAAFDPGGAVTPRTAELTITRVLGLGHELQALADLHTANGTRLPLPAGFPEEVLGAELGLRHNYPTADEALETNDDQSMPLADLVGMIDTAIHMPAWMLTDMQSFDTLVLPDLSANQQAVITAALAEVGEPYIWGGTSPTAQDLFGTTEPGGFDCSGLVWWAFKLSPQVAGKGVGNDIIGRTSDEMAWENPAERVALDKVHAGDLVFFGPDGPKTARGDISHVAISLGNGWVVQSTGDRGGVSVSYLPDYWVAGEAWGRQPAAMAPAASSAPVQTTAATSSPMTREMWVALEAFVHAHYAKTLWSHVWTALTADPVHAQSVLAAQMTRTQWVALEQFMHTHYAKALWSHLWTTLTANPALAYAILYEQNLL